MNWRFPRIVKVTVWIKGDVATHLFSSVFKLIVLHSNLIKETQNSKSSLFESDFKWFFLANQQMTLMNQFFFGINSRHLDLWTNYEQIVLTSHFFLINSSSYGGV